MESAISLQEARDLVAEKVKEKRRGGGRIEKRRNEGCESQLP